MHNKANFAIRFSLRDYFDHKRQVLQLGISSVMNLNGTECLYYVRKAHVCAEASALFHSFGGEERARNYCIELVESGFEIAGAPRRDFGEEPTLKSAQLSDFEN